VTPAAVASRIRRLGPADRYRIESITRSTGLFWDYEIGIALEVFDEATGANPSGQIDPDYESAGIEVEGALVGWACWGPIPDRPRDFDLYWIVVMHDARGRGLGTMLIEEMNRRIAGRAGMVFVETSGRADYAPTRAFYERHGYCEVARIADHYAPGDDLVRYAKSAPVSASGRPSAAASAGVRPNQTSGGLPPAPPPRSLNG
jgi:ribosomal protein S18 acetylase RimI-like enzyme